MRLEIKGKYAEKRVNGFGAAARRPPGGMKMGSLDRFGMIKVDPRETRGGLSVGAPRSLAPGAWMRAAWFERMLVRLRTGYDRAHRNQPRSHAW